MSTVGDEIAPVFAAVMVLCDRHRLIGREMFAIDGVKSRSHAGKQRSGTRAESVRQAEKLVAAARVARLQRHVTELCSCLATHSEERRGPKGTVRQSNRTDHDSATMATSKSVIQGDTGVAAVDAHAQIIVVAQAYGTGSVHALLEPIIDALAPVLASASLVTADAGYHSEAAGRLMEARATPGASRQSSPCLRLCGTTSGSIALHCACAQRSTRIGDSTVSGTPSRNSPNTATRRRADSRAQAVDVMHRDRFGRFPKKTIRRYDRTRWKHEGASLLPRRHPHCTRVLQLQRDRVLLHFDRTNGHLDCSTRVAVAAASRVIRNHRSKIQDSS